jgi:hypothetical protein
VTPCSVVVGYQRFGGPRCFHLQVEVNGMGKNGIDIGQDWRGAACTVYSFHLEDGSSIDLRNIGVLSLHYTESQPKRRLET